MDYYLKAKTKFKIHSPRLFQIISDVILDTREYYSFTQIERIRTLLLQDETQLTLQDYGAGSRIKNRSKSVKQIVKTAASSPQKGKELHRLIKSCQCKHILELGTNVGLGSLYMATANPKSNLITIEGDPELARYAQRHFDQLQIHSIQLINDQFDLRLPALLKSLHQPIDCVYLDGNHQMEATKHYYSLIAPYLDERSVIILDDIRWSSDMYTAWKAIASLPEWSTLDLGSYGVLFSNAMLETAEKMDLAYIDFWKKPWQIGLFAN